MKTVVIYKSKSGFVKNYAEWIAGDLSADIFEATEIDLDKLKTYDTIIYGGGLYAVGINGIKFITQNLNELKDKNIIVYASGASPSRDEIRDEVKNRNFKLDEQKYIEFFYLRGGFDYDKLTFMDKRLMRLMKFKLQKKKDLTPDEKGMLEAYDNPVDFTNKKNIKEIIDYVNTLEN